MKIKCKYFVVMGVFLAFNLYATDYYFCKAINFNTKVPKEQGDAFVAFYDKDVITLIDQIHATNLLFVNHARQPHDEYDLYQRKEGPFNYTAKVYKEALQVKLTRYNRLDGIDIPETTFKCKKGSNTINVQTVKKLSE